MNFCHNCVFFLIKNTTVPTKAPFHRQGFYFIQTNTRSIPSSFVHTIHPSVLNFQLPIVNESNRHHNDSQSFHSTRPFSCIQERIRADDNNQVGSSPISPSRHLRGQSWTSSAGSDHANHQWPPVESYLVRLKIQSHEKAIRRLRAHAKVTCGLIGEYYCFILFVLRIVNVFDSSAVVGVSFNFSPVDDC